MVRKGGPHRHRCLSSPSLNGHAKQQRDGLEWSLEGKPDEVKGWSNPHSGGSASVGPGGCGVGSTAAPRVRLPAQPLWATTSHTQGEPEGQLQAPRPLMVSSIVSRVLNTTTWPISPIHNHRLFAGTEIGSL